MGFYTPTDSVEKEILTVEELDYLVHRFKDLEEEVNKQLKFEFPMKFDYLRRLNDFHVRVSETKSGSMKMLHDTTKRVNDALYQSSRIPSSYFS